jgi:hypothetical protein
VRAAASGGTRERAVLAYAYGVAGREVEALAIVEELTRTGVEYAPPYHIAMAYIGLKDREAAMSWLERAYVERDPHLNTVGIASAFASLRSEPRFAEILRAMGVVIVRGPFAPVAS